MELLIGKVTKNFQFNRMFSLVSQGEIGTATRCFAARPYSGADPALQTEFVKFLVFYRYLEKKILIRSSHLEVL